MRLHGIASLLIVLVFAACQPSATAPTTNTPAPPTPTTAVESDNSNPDNAETNAQNLTNAETNAYNGPTWTQTELVNARTGETFRLADFAGKSVFVEPFATWCTNCRNQMSRVNSLIGQPNTENYVFVALSVESGITAEDLADYAERYGFNFIFAALPDAMIADLVAQFGRSITNPPSTPHFIIRPNGDLSPLTTGPESAEEILAQLAGG